jgi:3D (Asp-Asp-Asp) domain-containing protein
MRDTARPRPRILLLAALALALGCGDEAPDRPGTDAAGDSAPPDLGTPDGPSPGDWSAPLDGGIPYIDISQDKGQLVGQMWITYYYLAKETDYPGPADTTLYDANCAPIVDVSAAFSDAVCIEGSGLLQDGRVINYASTCSCGRPCPTGGIVCYAVLDKATYPWGMGAASNPLVPLRSWAVDKSEIPLGTVLYAEEWDGVTMPGIDGLGGFVHDGCFVADDVGGAITGLHYDFFAGTKAMWLALEQIHGTKSTFTVYKNGGRCAYLLP